MAVFELLAPSLVPNATSAAEAKQTVTGSVAVLMKYNLLKVRLYRAQTSTHG